MSARALLLKTAMVLHYKRETPRGDGWTHIVFAHIPDGDEPGACVHVDALTWAKLGRPQTITVTVEPGDRLNT